MASVLPNDEVIWSLKIEVLHDLREELVKNLMPEKFFSYLRSKRVFDADDCDIIDSEKLKRKKAEKFLDILESKGPNAFNEFCNFIRINKTQIWMHQKIMELFEEKKRDRISVQSQQEASQDENKNKPVDTVTIAMPTTPSLNIPNMAPSSAMLPGPPTPPDEIPGISTSNDEQITTTFSGNSVSQVTSPQEDYANDPLPPYSSDRPASPPPPYRE